MEHYQIKFTLDTLQPVVADNNFAYWLLQDQSDSTGNSMGNAGGVHFEMAVEGWNLGNHPASANPTFLHTDCIRVYPNPSDGLFNFSYQNDKPRLIHLIITDGMGKTIFNESRTESVYQSVFDLSTYPVGIYYLQVMDGENYYSFKIMKK